MSELPTADAAMTKLIISSLLGLYAEIDAKAALLKEQSGLSCPDMCGACCLSRHIEISPLDVMPIVASFLAEGRLEEFIRRLEALPPASACALYESDGDDESSGRCGVYPLRPTTCRAFGFAAVSDKLGGQRLAACKRQKEFAPSAVACASAAIGAGLAAPAFRDIRLRLYEIEPGLGSMRMHINEALLFAAARAALRASLALSSDGDEDRPIKPPRPRRAA